MTIPEGHLPVFSVSTGAEAQKLIVAACPFDAVTEEYVARELVEEQTLDNLARFSQRLAYTWFELMQMEPERSRIDE